MLKMKIISLLKNPKIRISLIILTALITIVSIVVWPKSKADQKNGVAFRAATMKVYAGGKDILIPEIAPGQTDQASKSAKYNNIYCIDEGTLLDVASYNTEINLYNAAEAKKYFKNYNSMIWLVDNMYISTGSNANVSLEHLSNLLTSPEVKANVTSYGDITADQIKSINKTVGNGKDYAGNLINRNLIEVLEQLVIWNYTDNLVNTDFDSLVKGGLKGSSITDADQNVCKYVYFGLRYLADKNSSYTSNGTTSNVITLDKSSAKIDTTTNKVGPYSIKANGITLNANSVKSKISAAVTDNSGNKQQLNSDKVVVNNDGSFYIDANGINNITKTEVAVTGVYSGASTQATVIVNGSTQDLLNVRKNASTTNLADNKELSYSGKYSIKLVKTKKDGVTTIKNNPAEFSITGAKTINPAVTNNEGILSIVDGKNIESEKVTDSYEIVETKAPNGYQKYNGSIKLDVKFKLNGTNYVLDKENTKLTGNGTNGTVKLNFENDSTITITVPNTETNVEVHKGVKQVYNQDSGYNKNEIQDWVIQTKLPQGIKEFKKYVITDTIDKRLSFTGVNTVKVSVVNGKELTINKDYKVEYNEQSRTLEVIFIKDSFKGESLVTGDIIQIKFNTKFALDENGNIIALNQSVPNQAVLVYDNGDGVERKSETEKPEVHTGGVGLYKYDDKNRNGKHDEGEPALEGAHFKIAKNEEDAKNGIFVKDSNGKDLEAVSNKHGVAVFVGLEFGEDAMNQAKYKTSEVIFGNTVYAYDWSKVETTYYIVETESPEGYSKIEKAIKAVVKKDNYNISDVKSLIQVGNISNVHDLSLRKFITQVDNEKVTNRIPKVDLTDLASGKSTTAKYNHTKDPVLVATNQIVTYTIRVYNEGPQDTYASLVKDNMPEGLEFLTYTEGDGSINAKYRWKLVDENGKEVTDPAKAKYTVTDYLAMDKEEKNLIKGFSPATMKELDYRDLQIQFKVKEPNTSDRILINKAQISEETDYNGKVVKDRDSTPDVWNEGEDDQDIEKLRVLYFDLALRKWVTEAIVTENGQTQIVKTGHKAEDDPEEVVKVDLKKSKIKDVVVKFRYSIRVTNQGEIPGEALEVRDDIPAGLKFVPADNPDWKEVDGKVVTNKLANKTLQPGESADVEIVLTWINGEKNMGVKTNIAEISKDHNKYGSPDIDSTPGNYVPGEDDIDDAPVMLTVKTGSQAIAYIAVIFGALAIVGIGVVGIKKFVK